MAEPGAQLTGGVTLGLPSGVNIAAGIVTERCGFRISGMYSGNGETNGIIYNGIQLDIFKPMGEFRSIKHHISAISGYTSIHNNKGDRLVYAGLGYALQWKKLFAQGGVGKQILTSNEDVISDIFAFMNIGLMFNLGSL